MTTKPRYGIPGKRENISLSLRNKCVKEIDRLTQAFQYRDREEFIRQAIAEWIRALNNVKNPLPDLEESKLASKIKSVDKAPFDFPQDQLKNVRDALKGLPVPFDSAEEAILAEMRMILYLQNEGHRHEQEEAQLFLS